MQDRDLGSQPGTADEHQQHFCAMHLHAVVVAAVLTYAITVRLEGPTKRIKAKGVYLDDIASGLLAEVI